MPLIEEVFSTMLTHEKQVERLNMTSDHKRNHHTISPLTYKNRSNTIKILVVCLRKNFINLILDPLVMVEEEAKAI